MTYFYLSSHTSPDFMLTMVTESKTRRKDVQGQREDAATDKEPSTVKSANPKCNLDLFPLF